MKCEPMRIVWRLWFGLSSLWAFLILGWMQLMPDDVRTDFQQVAGFLICLPIGLTGALLLILAWAFRPSRR